MEEMRLTLIPHEIDKLRLLIPFVFLPKVLAALCFLRLFVGNDGYVEPPHAIELIIVIGLACYKCPLDLAFSDRGVRIMPEYKLAREYPSKIESGPYFTIGGI